MKQPTPNVTFDDVRRIVQRDLPESERQQALDLIERMECPEKTRSTLACLKNSAGDLQKLERELKLAELDWRDVIAPAEYPNYSRKMFRIDDLSVEEREKLYRKDWEQYSNWLNANQ